MEGVDMIEKNEVNSNEGNIECESGSEDVVFSVLNEEKGVESNSSSSGLDSSSSVPEVSASDCTSPDEMLEIEMMKERFSKLLLGEDMSGSGNGVSTALAISNAITNLCATVFGQLWRLEPLSHEKKAMWQREMEWLLCVMTCRPRSDLYINLPALRKLDNMLLEILDSFVNTELRYVDQGVMALEGDGSSSFQRQEEKWWLPVPQLPPCGLHENSRKQLQHKRDCANQISKAAMAINNATLAEMQVPDTYLESLPKTARTSLGDVIYKYITSEIFSPESLLASLDISSEHEAIKIANRIEASIYIWHKKSNSKPVNRATRSSSRSSWGMFKDLIVEGDKSEMLIERGESLLFIGSKEDYGCPIDAKLGPKLNTFDEVPEVETDMESSDCTEDLKINLMDQAWIE
ncbi:hypothetical protein TSUD_264320 [Trifolium subterraneum]|uniref:PRONE domain-containing protein n=1 Tax=Trifolium subterraneum TaxID=3900 RepID=A0A2Z6MAV2_TRISU|nr:hypothetical protein TSUD_264320 [Trifolium subterraneum]